MSATKKIVITVTSIAVALIAVVAVLLFWRGSPKEILSVADQFQPPSSWKLDSELVRSPAFTCLDGGTCPEVHRIWSVGNKLSKEQFDNLIKGADWSFPTEGECQRPKNAYGSSVTICSAQGIRNGYRVTVWLSEDSSSPYHQEVVLSVRPE